WPGNIRQLENAVEFAHVMSGTRLEILPQDLPGWMQSPRFMLPEEVLRLELPEQGMDLIAFLSELERKLIQESLERTGGNRMQAARLLSLKRTTLVEKIRRMEICA
ncbi:MAG TPA: helix-turn-helix domain-containing protein, partial [Acidobacteriota bacterium]|nr:helix-turn-helix domain-containing protein [Acidobacteriota bacterium]